MKTELKKPEYFNILSNKTNSNIIENIQDYFQRQISNAFRKKVWKTLERLRKLLNIIHTYIHTYIHKFFDKS